MSTKEIQEQIVKTMRQRQAIENASVASTGQVIEKTANQRALLRIDRIEQLRVGQAGLKPDDDTGRMQRRYHHARHGAEEDPDDRFLADDRKQGKWPLRCWRDERADHRCNHDGKADRQQQADASRDKDLAKTRQQHNGCADAGKNEQQGKDVTVVEILGAIARGMPHINSIPLELALEKNNVRIMMNFVIGKVVNHIYLQKLKQYAIYTVNIIQFFSGPQLSASKSFTKIIPKIELCYPFL